MRQQQVERRRVGDQAARRRDDRFRIAPDRFLQRPALVAAVGIRAVERVDLRETAAREMLDLARQLHERKPEVIGEHRSERRLAGAAQADECDPVAAPQRSLRVEHFGQCDPRSTQVGVVATLENSRISSHSGEDAVTSPSSSAREHCSAVATCCSTRIDALPMPYSRFARWRSDTPACATALRVRPRRARMLRTRSSATAADAWQPRRRAPRDRLVAGAFTQHPVASASIHCTIVLDSRSLQHYRRHAGT